jgi:hypothetical protein
MNMHPFDGAQALTAGEAILVVDSGGQRYAFEMKLVAEIRTMQAVQIAGPGQGVLHRNGVRVPVFGLDDSPCPGSSSKPGALVVLDLPDRLAAVAVDAVCEVRITQARSYLAPAKGSNLGDSVAWVAVWEGGEAPVLDASAWLRAREAQSAEPCVSS